MIVFDRMKDEVDIILRKERNGFRKNLDDVWIIYFFGVILLNKVLSGCYFGI